MLLRLFVIIFKQNYNWILMKSLIIPDLDQDECPLQFCFLQNDPLSLTMTQKPEKIFSQIYQMPIFIWIDLDSKTMEEIKIQFKAQTDQSLICISSFEQLKKQIDCSKQNRPITVICSSEIDERVVNEIYPAIKTQKIKNLILYGQDNSQWQDDIPFEIEEKIHSVKEQGDVIPEIIKFKKFYAKPPEFNNFISLSQQIGASNQLNHILFAMINQRTNRAQLCNQLKELVRMIVPGEEQKTDDIIEQIKQRPLDTRSAIELYTSESFLYGLINNILRLTKESVSIFIFQPYFCDLFNAIKNLYHEQKKEAQLQTIKCYRGGVISEREFSFFQKNINSIIRNLGFMSTSKSEQIANNFIKNVIFDIEVSYSHGDSELDFGFAYVEDYSSNKGEHEVLFNPLNTFKVMQARVEENIFRISLKHIVIDKILNKQEIDNSQYFEKLKILSYHQKGTKKQFKNQNSLITNKSNKSKGSYQFCKKYLEIAVKSGEFNYIIDAYFKMRIEYNKRGELQNFEQNYHQFLKISGDYDCGQKYFEKKIQIFRNQYYKITDDDNIFSPFDCQNFEQFFSRYQQFLQKGKGVKKNQYSKYIDFYSQQRVIIEKKYSRYDPSFANYTYEIGINYKKQGNYQQALKQLYLAEDIYLKVTWNDFSFHVKILMEIGTIYESLGQFNKSLEYYFKSLEIARKQNYSLIPDLLLKIYKIYQTLHDYQKSQQYENECKKIIKNSIKFFIKTKNNIKEKYGKNHHYYLLSIRKISHLYEVLREHKKAIQYQHEFQKIIMNKFGKNHEAYVNSLVELAQSYFLLKNYERASYYYRKVVYLTQKIFGNTHYGHFYS